MISASFTDIFRFDNSYSWFHGKDVFYAIELINPADVTLVRGIPSNPDLEPAGASPSMTSSGPDDDRDTASNSSSNNNKQLKRDA